MKKGDRFYCIKTRYHGEDYYGNILFEKGYMYEFVGKNEFDFEDYDEHGMQCVGTHVDYTLDRIPDGKREIFYNTENFNEYFIDLRKLRMKKLLKINENEN